MVADTTSLEAIRADRLEILLVEDEATIATCVAEALGAEGHHVCVEHDGERALTRLKEAPYQLMISDIRLPGMGGLELFDWVQRNAPATSVLLMSGYGSIPEAVAAVRQNAVHYLAKPFDLDELLKTVEQVAERVRMTEFHPPVGGGDAMDPLIGRSVAMVGLKERLVAIAASDAPILIHGETGTGKEIAARAIHGASQRRSGPFVAVNCGALPETLAESELFGHERGAYTGAHQRHDGKFVVAAGGTLFLDEITAMPLACQVKLLRALQEGVVQPLGSNKLIKTDIRILAATNENLREVLRMGKFREDLFYRLKVLDVYLPPLRERKGDLPVLVAHFLDRFTPNRGKAPGLSAYAWALLRRYPFPGNVRELEHAIQHAVILSGGETIEPQHLPDDIRGAMDVHDRVPLRLSEALAEFEREFIVRTLEQHDGNRTLAAQQLGISRKNLWEKVKRHKIDMRRRSVS